MDKIACWIDLAVPHSGTWTEGMMADDEAVYLRVRKLRDAWRREEAANIAGYLKHQKAASSPPVTLPSRLTPSR